MKYKNITILTGAGISAESGIPTYRTGEDKLWGTDFKEFSTIQSLRTNRIKSIEAFNERKRRYIENDYKPNAGHFSLAKLENYWRDNKIGCFNVITQNIDSLHELAGSNHVVHMHGSLAKKRRIDTNNVVDWGNEPLNPDLERPEVVLFGEEIMHGRTIESILNFTDLYIAVGTSMTVFPASDFVLQVKQLGGYTIFVNEEKCFLDGRFHKTIYGKSSEILPKLVDDIINELL